MDCLIVIGTALETNFAIRMVDAAIRENKLLIEINPYPIIVAGNTKTVKTGSEEALPIMLQPLLKKLEGELSPKNNKIPTKTTGFSTTNTKQAKATTATKNVTTKGSASFKTTNSSATTNSRTTTSKTTSSMAGPKTTTSTSKGVIKSE